MWAIGGKTKISKIRKKHNLSGSSQFQWLAAMASKTSLGMVRCPSWAPRLQDLFACKAWNLREDPQWRPCSTMWKLQHRGNHTRYVERNMLDNVKHVEICDWERMCIYIYILIYRKDFHGLSILVNYNGVLHAHVMHIHKGATNHSTSSSILLPYLWLLGVSSMKMNTNSCMDMMWWI